MQFVVCMIQGGVLLVCKALSVDTASLGGGRGGVFHHTLCYTLINLLKTTRPVSSRLALKKSPEALNPAEIFSMGACGKSVLPQSSTAFCRCLQKCIYRGGKYTHHHLPMMDGRWGGSCRRLVVKACKNNPVCWFTLTSRASAFCWQQTRR